MQVILLFGPGEVSKRNAALKIKAKYSPDAASTIDLKTSTEEELKTAILSPSLFLTDERLVVVENPPEKMDLNEFKASDNNLTVLIIASNLKALSTILTSAKKIGAKIYPFEGEKEVNAFAFLDYLIEGKTSAFIELDKLLSEYGGMYVLTMVYYLLRRNFIPSTSSFMKQKSENQKKRFKSTDWSKLYKLALDTEFKIKSGILPEEQAIYNLTQKFITFPN